MTKKKKYTPGWQQRKVAEDRETLQKVKDVLDSYYEAKRVEEQVKTLRQPVEVEET